MTDNRSFQRRTMLTGILIFALGISAAARIIYLNIDNSISIDADTVKVARRGSIKDCNGNILAVSVPADSAYANPEEITDPLKTADIVSKILSCDSDQLAFRLSLKRKFIWLKRNMDPETALRLERLHIKGIYLLKENIRAYPYTSLASNLLGFCGFDNSGLEGVEYRYNDLLNGVNEDNIGSLHQYSFGLDVSLTIDKNIQYIAENEVRNNVIERNAVSGAAIVMETKTGRILALAKYPAFDSNNFGSSSLLERKFYAVTEAFEPGSVMKIFSAAAWLEKTKTPNKTFVCTGAIQIGDTTINCTGVHGNVSMYDAIRYSCNSGVMSAMSEISQKDVYAIMHRFGFGQVSGSGIPGEAAGILRTTDKWSGLSKYSIAVGQEISVSIIQLAAAYSAVANNGIYYNPYIISQVEDMNGTVMTQSTPVPGKIVLSESISETLKKMLHAVVTKGTGTKAAMRLYSCAGKTGTAQKYLKAGYVKNINTSSFAGFAPYEDPDITVVVVMDEPQGITSAADVAAPVFSRIAENVLIYRGTGGKKSPVFPVLKSSPASKAVPVRVPDFAGYSAAYALELLEQMKHQYQITYTISGHGSVVSQSVGAGEPVTPGMKIEIVMKDENN